MKFTKNIILYLFLTFFFLIPASAEEFQNGGFETGDTSYWSFVTSYPSNLFCDVGSYARTGDYGVELSGLGSGGTHSAYIKQTFASKSFSRIYFSYNMNNVDNGYFRFEVHSTTTGTYYSGKYTVNSSGWVDTYYDFGSVSQIDYVKIAFGPNTLYSPYEFDVQIDNIGTEYTSHIKLMEFTNEPIEVGNYAHLEVNLDDYWDTKADEHYYLSYDYYYKNISNYTIINFNELELNAKNTVNFISTYYPYFNQTGGCEIKASLLYTYRDPVYQEVDLGFISTVLVNSTYEPPEEPEEPEEPEIPDPEPEPDPEPNPPIPPTQPNGIGANQSINVTWTGEYYNVVNNTFGGLCSPIYNFTNWSLSPIYSLNNSIGEFNYYMNESFTQTAQDSSILYESINTIYGAIHPKIRNVITYYLIWVVLLIVLKKD